MLADRFSGRGPLALFPNIVTSHLQHAGSVYRGRPCRADSAFESTVYKVLNKSKLYRWLL